MIAQPLSLAGCWSGALSSVIEPGKHPGTGLLDLDSDEFRRLSVTNEFVAAPHIYELDADNAEYVAPHYYASRRAPAVVASTAQACAWRGLLARPPSSKLAACVGIADPPSTHAPLSLHHSPPLSGIALRTPPRHPLPLPPPTLPASHRDRSRRCPARCPATRLSPWYAALGTCMCTMQNAQYTVHGHGHGHGHGM